MVISVAGTIIIITLRKYQMISVGVDVSKGKSTICILKPYGEIVCSPFEVQHEEGAMEAFANMLAKLDGEIRVVMEATGIYHLPVLIFLHDKKGILRVCYQSVCNEEVCKRQQYQRR